jgi:caa(3)-type oxidase subunit IV
MVFFMHLKGSNRLIWTVAGAGFVWLSFLLVLTIGDFVTRVPIGPGP